MTDALIYVVVLPTCGVLAMLRVPFQDLRWGIAAWSVPALVGSYVLFVDQMSGLRLWMALALAQCAFVIIVASCAWLHDWLQRRFS